MAGSGLMAVLVVGLVVLFVALPLWTATDAAHNSSQSAFLWGLVVFLAPLLGIALYFLLGRDEGGDGGRASVTDLPPQYRP
ncbi:MAG: PLDc N-terminal domain-containing protein [Halobacteriaceae archaeon]